MDKKLLITIGLCVGLGIAWSVFIGQSKKTPPTEGAAAGSSGPAPATAASAGAAAAVPTAVAGSAATAAVSAAPAPAPAPAPAAAAGASGPAGATGPGTAGATGPGTAGATGPGTAGATGPGTTGATGSGTTGAAAGDGGAKVAAAGASGPAATDGGASAAAGAVGAAKTAGASTAVAPPGPVPPPSAPASAVAMPSPLKRAPLMYTAKHELYTAKFVDQGATLVSFELREFETPDRKGPMDLVVSPISDPSSRPFAVELLSEEPQAKLDMQWGVHDCKLLLRPGTELADQLECKWSDGKRMELVKRIRFRPKSYVLDVETEVRNLTTSYLTTNVAIQVTAYQGPVQGGGCFQPPPDVASPSCFAGTSVEKDSPEDIVKKHGGRRPIDGAVWTGVDMRYFLAAIIPRDATDAEDRLAAFNKNRCELVVRPGNAIGGRMIPQRELKLPAGKGGIARFSAYMGPKDHKALAAMTFDKGGVAVNVEVEQSVDFWILGFICRPLLWLLNLFYDGFGNYGIAIILLTLVVKLITFWPAQKSYKSMESMRRLKGPMDELRAKYGKDKARLNQEMMGLYKTHKVNPLGGCLPLLLQMPVWIALYRTIYSSVEIYQQPFFGWIQDLSAKDPYYVLPILLGVVMFVQQRMSPSTGDSGQMKMMLYGMPILFTGMMLFFPSGLVLYIFVNTLLSILQQWVIRRQAAKGKV